MRPVGHIFRFVCVCVCLVFFFFWCLPVCFFFGPPILRTGCSAAVIGGCVSGCVCVFFFLVSLLVFVVVAFAGLDFLPRTKDLPPGCMSSVSVLCVCVCVFFGVLCVPSCLVLCVCVSVFLFVCLCLLVVGLVCLCLSGSSCLLVLAAFTKDLPLADS